MIILNKTHFLKSCVYGALFFLGFNLAHADASDAINFVGGVSTQRDNNLFKTNGNEESENITTVFAGLRFNKQYSLQRFKLDATVSNYNYSNNDYLSFTGKNYDAAWYWSLTPKLTGTISADRSESLNNFIDTRNASVRNTRVTQNQVFLADFAPGGGWHLLAGLSRNTLKNSETFNQIADFSANALDVGAKYEFKSGSSITLMNHVRKGRFDDRPISQASLLDSGYKEREYEMKLDWLVTAKSQLNFVASYLNRDHDNFSSRDYSGLQAGLSYSWAPTAKIKLVLAANSRLDTFQSNTNDFTRTNSFSISPSYDITEKIKLRGGFNVSERNFKGNGISQSDGRVDDLRSFSIGVDWLPTNYLTLGLTIQKTNQDSTVESFEYDDTTATASANLMF
jgi:exopolysaccharide biosynthesis operon protein EpsL